MNFSVKSLTLALAPINKAGIFALQLTSFIFIYLQLFHLNYEMKRTINYAEPYPHSSETSIVFC